MLIALKFIVVCLCKFMNRAVRIADNHKIAQIASEECRFVDFTIRRKDDNLFKAVAALNCGIPDRLRGSREKDLFQIFAFKQTLGAQSFKAVREGNLDKIALAHTVFPDLNEAGGQLNRGQPGFAQEALGEYGHIGRQGHIFQRRGKIKIKAIFMEAGIGALKGDGFNVVAAKCQRIDFSDCRGNRDMLDIGVVFKHTAADGGKSDLKHRERALGVRGAFLQIRRHIRRNRHGFVLVAFEIAAADQNAPRNCSCFIFIQQRGVPGRMLADGKNIKAVWSIGPRLSVFQLLFGIDMIYEFFVKDIRVISVILKFHALDFAVN